MDASSISLAAPSEIQNKNVNSHRRVESEIKISNPKFFRGFRRENSDFFPLSSTRHSAIFVDRNINPLRSSGFFNNRRGSDVNITSSNTTNGEPVLTDFIKRNMDKDSSNSVLLRDPKFDYLKPRREKTESDIVLRNSAFRQGLRSNLEARRTEIESKFSQEANDFRRRSAKPLDISINSDKVSFDAGEYMYLQVTCFCVI